MITKLQKGFFIVELLVVLGIFSVLAFFLSYVAIYHFQTFNSETAELNITSDARVALDDIDNYVRQSSSVLSSYSTYNTSSTTLVLQVPSVGSSGQLIDSTYDNVVFYFSGTDFYRRVFPNVASSRLAVTQKLASNVVVSGGSAFSFTYDNATYSLVKKVTTSITISQIAGTKTKSITVSSQSTLRNYSSGGGGSPPPGNE